MPGLPIWLRHQSPYKSSIHQLALRQIILRASPLTALGPGWGTRSGEADGVGAGKASPVLGTILGPRRVPQQGTVGHPSACARSLAATLTMSSFACSAQYRRIFVPATPKLAFV
ncbi:unnamed protein product, partial [Ectocarpus sp. 12 AP-2014]